MAKRLADVPDTFRVMHDRRIRGTKANIDHIAIGPSGVWVIDAKRYKDKRPELRVAGSSDRGWSRFELAAATAPNSSTA